MLKTVSSIVNAIGALNYKGTWNASTNTPALASGVGTKGDYYVVSVAGSTNLDGETLWGVGDWAVFNGAVWQKVEGGNTINATTVSASTSVTTPIVQSSTSAGTTLKNASGTTCIQYGAGGGTNVTIEAAINMNGANAHIEMSPTGTGHVTIKPTAVGDMDNMIIGATTPLAGTFTTLTSTGNTILGDASTDTLNVGNGGLIKDASGNVGIGTASPSVKLDIQGAGGALSAVNPPLQVWDTTALAANIGGGIAFGGNYTGSTKTNWAGIAGLKDNAVDGEFGGYLALYTRANGGGNVERMRIASNGIVTMSAYGAGAATFSAAGVISSVSDETWKTKDGVPLNPDAMLKKLEPGYWFYNEEKAPIFGADRQLGFYAQNVNYAIGVEAAPIPETYSEIDKNGVETIKTKPWGYYDRSVLAVTVMSLQKALATIESLTARLEVLEGK